MAKLTSKPLTFKDIQVYVRDIAIERGFAEETIAQKFMLLSEEIGEFSKATRKNAGIKSASVNNQNIAHEAADVLFVLVNICNKLGINIDQAFREKEEINNSRSWT